MSDDLEALFRREYARLVRALAVAYGDHDRAADAVQDAFVQASRHWRRVRHYDAPVAWIHRVAVNRMVDQHRVRQRATRTIAAVANATHPTSTGSIGHATTQPSESRAELIDLERALTQLPERQRLVVTLHYLADLSVSQIAATLDIAPGTVKSQLHDARQHLFKLLEVHDDS